MNRSDSDLTDLEVVNALVEAVHAALVGRQAGEERRPRRGAAAHRRHGVVEQPPLRGQSAKRGLINSFIWGMVA